MKATHTTMIHGTCPINDSQDYYELQVDCDFFLSAEEVELAANVVRGKTMTQEAMATAIYDDIYAGLPDRKGVQITLIGRHGQNVATEVRVP